jgi:hypothetical protein
MTESENGCQSANWRQLAAAILLSNDLTDKERA